VSRRGGAAALLETASQTFRRSRAYAKPAQGIALILLAAAFFASLDSTTRGLTVPGSRWAVPVLLVMTVRYSVQAVVMALVLAPRGRPGFAPAHPRFQWLRGVLLLATSFCSFFGVSLMPVPEFTAINMLTPLLVTLLSATLLRERVSRLRWALVAGGFAGALVVIRPGSGAFGWVVVLPLAGAACYASFQVLTSRLAGAENPMTTHFWTGAVGSTLLWPILLAAAASQGWDASLARVAAIAPSGWALMGACGLLGTCGHLFLILALGKAPTATLMPFVYVQIGFAALIGWLAFSHLPDHWAWVGMGIIAACGATSAALNIRRAGASSPTAAVDVAPE
jgi:drug/metabolite transporter (DMT)-like permease